MSPTESKQWVEDPRLRQTAFSVEQMAPGGIERSEPGQLDQDDLFRAFELLGALLKRPGTRERRCVKTILEVRERTEALDGLFRSGGGRPLVYVERAVFALEPRLRSLALEIDFTFGDRDGSVSPEDLKRARRRYGRVRGPVGWNRLLVTDEIERKLFPHRTLRSTDGPKLTPPDWLAAPPNPHSRLEKVRRSLDDAALARTYADVAARLACTEASSRSATLYEEALRLLGEEIGSRGSIRPTITDIARIGCEDPGLRASLRTPIEMSRRLCTAALLDRFLS